jgi:AraC-like DNA-binding protein
VSTRIRALSEIVPMLPVFSDYRHFARTFRHRFGHAPGGGSQTTVAPFDRNINHWLAML